MLKQKFILGLALMAAVVLGGQTDVLAAGKKKEARFKVRVENVGSSMLMTQGGSYPFALSPGLFVVTKQKMDFFKSGKKAHAGLEAQAEDGNPGVLADELKTKVGSAYMGIFNTPVGAGGPGPILPGGAYEFEFMATEGMKLNVIAMFGQSNDLFYSPKDAINLFENGEAVSGDFTDKFMLWDAGTEINEAPGIGADQAPRQKGPNTGMAENGVVGLVKDGFSYPNTKDVLKITITKQ
jgi:hypothetical protein